MISTRKVLSFSKILEYQYEYKYFLKVWVLSTEEYHKVPKDWVLWLQAYYHVNATFNIKLILMTCKMCLYGMCF